MRSARASGWRRAASTASRVPTTTPACGPPSSLSPLKHTSAAPARTDRRTAGSSGRAPRAPPRGLVAQRFEVVAQYARADIVDHRDAQPAQRLDLDLLDEPERAEV